MPFSLSERSACVVRSEMRNMSLECDRVGGINLSQGICDTPVPEVVRRAAQRAIDDGWNSYTQHTGIAELRQAIARKLERYSGLTINPDTELVVSGGSTGPTFRGYMALPHARAAVIIFWSFYRSHPSARHRTALY